jgi:hypothetical protein
MIPQEILDKIIERWGVDSQIDKAIEEMSELTQALLKLRSATIHKKDFTAEEDHVCEEIADVSLMMEQLRRTIFPSTQIEKWEEFKIDRVSKILNK